MSVYLLLLLFFISLSLCILDKVKGDFSLKKIIFTTFIITLIIISSLKNDETSWDTQNYIEMYGWTNPISRFSYPNFSLEPGFVLIISICKEFTDSPSLLFLVISIIALGSYGALIWKYSPYPFLSIFIYYCWFFYMREMIIIRFGVASAIMLLSMIRLSENKIFKSLFWAVIASLFHYTALTYIVILGFWILFSKLKKIKIMETFLLISFPLAIAGITILKIAELVYSLQVLPIFFQAAMFKGMQYIDKIESRSLKVVLLYLPIFYFYRKCRKDIFFNNFYFIFLLAFFLTFELTAAFELGRIPMMYMTTLVLFLPIMLSKIKKSKYYLLYSYTMILVIYYFVRICFFQKAEINI
jgi:hypothetical protein